MFEWVDICLCSRGSICRTDQCYLRRITQSKCGWQIAKGDKEYNNMKDKCKIMSPWEQWHHWWKTNANIVAGNIPCRAFSWENIQFYWEAYSGLSCWKISIICRNDRPTNGHTTFFAYIFFHQTFKSLVTVNKYRWLLVITSGFGKAHNNLLICKHERYCTALNSKWFYVLDRQQL